MTKEEFKIFLIQGIASSGKSLEKLKKFYNEPNEVKLKKKLYKLLQAI